MNRAKPFDIFDKLTWGRHAGKMLGTVIEEEPSYVQWLLDEGYTLTKDALNYLRDCTE